MVCVFQPYIRIGACRILVVDGFVGDGISGIPVTTARIRGTVELNVSNINAIIARKFVQLPACPLFQ
jgi:hypothetical protein